MSDFHEQQLAIGKVDRVVCKNEDGGEHVQGLTHCVSDFQEMDSQQDIPGGCLNSQVAAERVCSVPKGEGGDAAWARQSELRQIIDFNEHELATGIVGVVCKNNVGSEGRGGEQVHSLAQSVSDFKERHLGGGHVPALVRFFEQQTHAGSHGTPQVFDISDV